MKKQIFEFIYKNRKTDSPIFEIYKVAPARYRMYYNQQYCVEVWRYKHQFTGHFEYIIMTDFFEGFDQINIFDLHALLIK